VAGAGAGLGLKARGVNFPGHFMVKVNLPKGQVVIDPFTGQSLSREELSERLEPYKRRNGLVDDFDVPVGLYLQAAPRATSLRACCATSRRSTAPRKTGCG
jgi:regulator of sirC expression with transglutaminase-like and TPR domain